MAKAKRPCNRLQFLPHKHLGFYHKTRKKILYPSLPSAICNLSSSTDELPVPKPTVTLPEPLTKSSESSCDSEFQDEPNTTIHTR